MKRIEYLEKRGAIALLLFFAEAEREAWMITELLSRIACSQRALYTAIQRLHKLGLVEEVRQPEFNRRYIRLTKTGAEVAAKLQEIAVLLEQG